MAKPISKIADSLKQLGEIQVNDWDFMSLMNKDIKDVEISKSLKRWGSIRVMEWDFKTALPAMNKIAHREVDIIGIVKRTAAYKVMEWDFRSALHQEHSVTSGHLGSQTPATPVRKAAKVIQELRGFLEYVVTCLVDEPKHARFTAKESPAGVLHFKVVLVKRDVAMLVGTGGHTAAAIRNLLKAAAEIHTMQALLVVVSHEENIGPLLED